LQPIKSKLHCGKNKLVTGKKKRILVKSEGRENLDCKTQNTPLFPSVVTYAARNARAWKKEKHRPSRAERWSTRPRFQKARVERPEKEAGGKSKRDLAIFEKTDHHLGGFDQKGKLARRKGFRAWETSRLKKIRKKQSRG